MIAPCLDLWPRRMSNSFVMSARIWSDIERSMAYPLRVKPYRIGWMGMLSKGRRSIVRSGESGCKLNRWGVMVAAAWRSGQAVLEAWKYLVASGGCGGPIRLYERNRGLWAEDAIWAGPILLRVAVHIASAK